MYCYCFSLLPFLCGKEGYEITVLSLCPLYQLLNQLISLHKIQCEYYAIRDHVIICFLISYIL